MNRTNKPATRKPSVRATSTRKTQRKLSEKDLKQVAGGARIQFGQQKIKAETYLDESRAPLLK